MADYLVPNSISQTEIVIKKSRFIAFSAPAHSSESAHQFIASIRQQYPDAGHVCYAFVAGQPNNTSQVGFSDDGEPSGTAGMPMLNVLQHGEIGDIVIAVVRYFGGIKLGTGGLARAYSGSVSEVIKLTKTEKRVAKWSVSFSAPFALEAQIRRLLEQASVDQIKVDYADQLKVSCDVPETKWQVLQQALSDLSKGEINLKLPEKK